MVVKRKPWDMGEVRRLIELKRAGRTSAQVAEALGRPVHSIGKHWKRYGTPRDRRLLTRDREQELRRLHALGHACPAIAERLGVCVWTVRKWLYRIGLKPWGMTSERVRAEQARHNRTRQRLAGMSLAEQRSEVWRIRAASVGWLGAETPSQVKILDLLEKGPCIVGELTAVLCRRPQTIRMHLRRLVALGLAVRGQRRVPWKLGLTLVPEFRLADGAGRHRCV